MSSKMEYKGYVGSVEFSEEDKLFFGSVQGISSLVSYEGYDANELVNDYHRAVDDYLETCSQKNTEPERAYKGTFNVRVRPELHKGAAIYAMTHDMTLNRFIEKAMDYYLSCNN